MRSRINQSMWKYVAAALLGFCLSQPSFAELDRGEVQYTQNILRDLYADELREYGFQIYFENRYEESSLNAYTVPTGELVIATTQGGILNHQDLTEEILATISCHLIGNYLGGAPSRLSNETNISARNQVEYWVGAKCLKRYFKAEQENREPIFGPTVVNFQCQRAFDDESDAQLCIRTSLAAKETLKLIGAQDSDIDFAAPDLSVTDATKLGFTNSQCRLDTFFQGALCNADPETPASHDDAGIGFCKRAHGGSDLGTRPLCWFNPN